MYEEVNSTFYQQPCKPGSGRLASDQTSTVTDKWILTEGTCTLWGAPYQTLIRYKPYPNTCFSERSFIKQGRKLKWLISESNQKKAANDHVGNFLRGKKGRSVLEWARLWWYILIGHVN